jgi:hypothetical protein
MHVRGDSCQSENSHVEDGRDHKSHLRLRMVLIRFPPTYNSGVGVYSIRSEVVKDVNV